MTQTRFKKIPFDLELAKKITNKEVKGRIVTRDGKKARIICFDRKTDDSLRVIVALVLNDRGVELVNIYHDNGGHSYLGEDGVDLQIEVPTYYEDYSNFEPCKWQPCLVRDTAHDCWGVQVCAGSYKYGDILFYSVDGRSYTWGYRLPLTEVTERLIGTCKSYEELMEELDAELNSTNKLE